MRAILHTILCMLTTILITSTCFAQSSNTTRYKSSLNDDTYALFLELFDFELSETFNPTINPFRQQQRRYNSILQKLSRERRKQELRFARSGGRYQESALHRRLRDQLKKVEKEMSLIYDKRLRTDAIQLDSIYTDIIGLNDLIGITNGELKASAEKMLDRYLEQAQLRIQTMIDTVIGHQPWLKDYDSKIPEARRKMYERISKKLY